MPYVERDIKFDSVERFIEYLKCFHFEGVSFSGGEPFLRFDRLHEYVSAIRDAFGNQHYLWVYTNGDLVTEDRLNRLADAGLDEIRFDISARDYDLGPLTPALARVPHVGVEIPAIPEDTERVKALLPRLESMGVEYLNLHQLMMNDYNQEAYKSRGYTVLRDTRFVNSFPVPESESAALEILNHAAESDVQLGINCCSRLYKHYFQERGFRRRYAHLCRSDDEEVTRTGFLRSLSRSECADSGRGAIDLLDSEGDPVKVIYSTPGLRSDTDEIAQDVSVHHLAAYGAYVGKWTSAEFDLANQTARLFFQLLFIEQYDIDAAFNELSDLFESGSEERRAMRSELEEFYRRFRTYEYMPSWRSEETGL